MTEKGGGAEAPRPGVMSEFISTTCAGCGHVLRVPESVRGQDVKCPSCQRVVRIFSPRDTTMDIVGDDQLPEVAKEGDVIEKETVAPEPDRGPMTPQRTRIPSKASSRSLPAVRGGTGRRGASGRPAPPSPKSNTPLVLAACAGGAVLLIALIFVFAKDSKSENAKPATHSAKSDGKETPPNPEEAKLRDRAQQFVWAVNKWSRSRDNIDSVIDFYAADVGKMKIKNHYGDQLPEYADATIRASVTGDQGKTDITCTYRLQNAMSGNVSEEKGKTLSINWKKVDGDWRITDAP